MKKHYRQQTDCLNCGAELAGKFCYNCGQENLEVKESFGHVINHIISDYFHFDHQFFHTLKPLLFKPGWLTNQYIAGKRVQYLHPVKMYIFISLIYFVLLFKNSDEAAKAPELKSAGTFGIIDSVKHAAARDQDTAGHKEKFAGQKQINKSAGPKVIKQSARKKPKETNDFYLTTTTDTVLSQYVANQNKLPADKRDGFFTTMLSRKALAYREKYGSRSKDAFFDELKHNTPKIMFLLLPLFALILMAAFWNSKKYYMEHLMFTLHLHCFIFLFLAMVMLIQLAIPQVRVIAGWLDFAAALYIIWYVYGSLREVYRRNIFRTISKMAGISFMYLLAVTLCIFVLVVVTTVTAT